MKHIAIVFVCLCLFSCKTNDKKYNNHGISFTIPSGWEMGSDSEGLIFCERDCFLPCGFVSILWVNDSVDARKQLMKSIEEQNEIYKMSSTPHFDSIQESSFGKYYGYTSAYNVKTGPVHSTGYISSFNANNRTFIVQLYQEMKDENENTEAIKKISDSFNVAAE